MTSVRPLTILREMSFIVLMVIFLSSCNPSPEKRIYEERFSQAKDDQMQPPKAEVLLREMLARGEDPHAALKGDMGPPQMPMLSRENISLTWTVPRGWEEKPGSGMRLATLVSLEDKTIDVSIVSLGGQAGGIMANINRWLNQIHLSPLTGAEVEEFLARQEKLMSADGRSVALVDLTSLLQSKDSSSSGILAGIIEFPKQTVFIKMMGTLTEIDKNREAFKALCRSIHLKK